MAPVQKDVLAPGDSTVVELVFNTNSVVKPPLVIRKHANITSNDSTQAVVAINFEGKVVPDTDTVSTMAFGPKILQFGPDDRKQEITFENVKDSVSLSVKLVGYVMDDLAIKVPNKPIQPGKKGKIEIEWKGDLPEYDVGRSLTFKTGSSESPQFSAAYSIKGAKGPRPAPSKPIKPQQAANPQGTSRQAPTSKDVVKGAATSQPQGIPVKADSVKVENPLDQKQWPPK
ncbi:MAG: hypothetical protein A2W25_11115 [candidate division Zixibacteria bacterium RBG_16_53_22]|nr:MAG: hypothetical protein A2W25_11115 [candidate division Zixibacteria bacterium RBG_16_53_22]